MKLAAPTPPDEAEHASVDARLATGSDVPPHGPSEPRPSPAHGDAADGLREVGPRAGSLQTDEERASEDVLQPEPVRSEGAYEPDAAGERPRGPGQAGLPKRAGLARTNKLWLTLAAASSALLAASLLGLVPARAPTPPTPVAFAVAKTVDPVRLPERNVSAPLVSRLPLWSFPLCAKPREGARLYRVAGGGERDSLVVWCQGEFLLVDVALGRLADEAPRVTRLGRFAARGELPGGAVALDLDGDDVLDLALGVAPALGVVHRPFSGVFWLRGRAQGGFELPRTLVEMPVVGLAALELDTAKGSELVVLTRGDAVAQRPGELWLFAGGTSPTRAAVVPTALSPSELAAARLREGAGEVWLTSTQPGSLLRFRFSHQPAEWSKPERSELPLRGVQGFVAAPRDERGLYVRDVQNILRVETEGEPKLTLFREHAALGPSAWLQAAGEPQPVVFGATEGGFAWLRDARRNDRALGPGTRVLDVSSSGAGASQARAVLLIETTEQTPNLALVVLPADVRDEASELELRSGAVEAGPAEARVALE
jgi:hypothetical protein